MNVIHDFINNLVSEKGRGHERKRMQTPNQQFRSEYLAPK